jgi:hypothetical protein
MFESAFSLIDVLVLLIGGDLLIRAGKHMAKLTKLNFFQIYAVSLLLCTLLVGLIILARNYAGASIDLDGMFVLYSVALAGILTSGVAIERKKLTNRAPSL